MRQVAKVDVNGYFLCDVILDDYNDIPDGCITVLPDTNEIGFYKAKWNGEKWVEGANQSDINHHYKLSKIAELDNACTASILSGFYSDADGETRFYGFERQDQYNMIAYLSGINAGLQTTVLWKEKGGFPKEYTVDQFRKLYFDGFDIHLKSQWVKFHELKAQILACEDDSWKDITW